MALTVQRVVPILRIFDEARARDFYVGFLGCDVDWEHRFSERAPLYMQVSRGSLVLHLSEHHGDGSPGHTVYVAATGVRELHAELQAKDYPYLNPGMGESPGNDGGACLTLLDPFGNCLRIDERVASRVV
ncbi:glyoxalase superfamily protein [Qaidamihabitans albus]|uniref:glyoxalase superfamily protein n=1 Tax=Qaidamihabitans albus TaxID=2795733 RepID=UPI0018F1D25D|nr:glyoxalase superfamily protein [Qaidamihabitans albus]